MSAHDHTNEPSTRHSAADHAPDQHYEIRVSGHLGSRWATWFDGMTLAAENDGTSVIRGAVVDQAALHGLLQKLRDLGITLISLTPLPPETAIEHPHKTCNQAHDYHHHHHHHHHHHSRGATS